MSPREWIQRIEDILVCAQNILAFTRGLTLETFEENIMAVRAVAFEFVTMGEAARTIPENVKEEYPQIPWDKMQVIRNVIVHEYFRIEEEIIWKTCQTDIPPLISLLENILRDSNPGA
jgi:uncharacterized protein with HEPN domain